MINNFVSPAVNPLILAADKVQNSKNFTKGDNYIKAVQNMLITASFPMIKLWDSILKKDENLDAEQNVNLAQRSLCAEGRYFSGSGSTPDSPHQLEMVTLTL